MNYRKIYSYLAWQIKTRINSKYERRMLKSEAELFLFGKGQICRRLHGCVAIVATQPYKRF